MTTEMLRKLSESHNLEYDEVTQYMQEILEGRASDASIAAFLLALRTKGETVDELRAMLDVMDKFAVKIRPKVNGALVDTCGTGGDGMKTFNISTAAAFVASAAGVNIAKHGNRSVTSPLGSADALEYFGYDLDTEPEKVRECIEKIGIGFAFAPKFHPAMKNVAAARKQLGIRTAFNILGPLSNPAGIDAQIVGVSDGSLREKVAQLLKAIGRREAMIFNADDGMDELSNTCMNHILWLRDGSVETLDLNPKSFKIDIAQVSDLTVASKDEAARCIFKVLRGSADGKKIDVVLLNAAAALMVAGKAGSFDDAISQARQAVESGGAYKKLKELVARCGGVSKLEEIERRWENS